MFNFFTTKNEHMFKKMFMTLYEHVPVNGNQSTGHSFQISKRWIFLFTQKMRKKKVQGIIILLYRERDLNLPQQRQN